MNTKRFIVQIPLISRGSLTRRFNNFKEADEAAKEKQGMLFELEDGQTDINIDDNNQIIGGKLIRDYSSHTG